MSIGNAQDDPTVMTRTTGAQGAMVGIVIIGRNEGERLVTCLRSARFLGFPMVYVDSDSTDGSLNVARDATALIVNLDLERPFTAARARQEGLIALIAHAPALRYVQFVDGDCTLVPEWIATAQRFLDDNPSYAVACGRRRERRPEASLYNQMADIEWNTPVGDAAACGGDALIRLSAYQEVNGFDSALIAGEEPELCSRLSEAGWGIRRLDAEMTVHDAAMTHFAQYWKRATRSGFGYAQAWWTTRDRTRPLYARELLRAGMWTVLPVMLAMGGGITFHPALWLLAPFLYTMQVARIAWRFGVGKQLSWQRATLLTSSKIAETWGAFRYLCRMMTGSAGATISYK